MIFERYQDLFDYHGKLSTSIETKKLLQNNPELAHNGFNEFQSKTGPPLKFALKSL